MAYDLSGKVKLIQKPQTFASGFSKREIVVTVEDGKYSQDICLEFLQDKMSLLDKVEEGQTVKISFDIRGREYNGRYFNNLVGWRIVTDEAGATAKPAEEDGPPFPDDSEDSGELDDHPF
ncbi:MAG: DUF3127 domain-containing protein [Kiritimatiellia bacterium]|nr:DUF3127 domain-containing protein [Kiritimatiellia bacterium]